MNFSLREFAPPSVPVVHPGEVLAEKMEEMGMGFREMALRAARPEKTIAAVLRGDSSITTDMAVAFGFKEINKGGAYVIAAEHGNS